MAQQITFISSSSSSSSVASNDGYCWRPQMLV